MNATMRLPGHMTLMPEHENDGRALVYVDDTEGDGNGRELTLWVTPEVAAQWITVLQPLADRVKP